MEPARKQRSAGAISVCVLVSGGLDSCVMVAELARRYRVAMPVFIRQGLRWEQEELRHLRRFLRAVRLPAPVVLELPATDLYGRHWSITGRGVPDAAAADEEVYLPGRNLLLLAKAAVFCAQHDLGVIAVGSLGHNPFADAAPGFFREFARVAGRAVGRRLRVIAPFRQLRKEQVIRLGRTLPLRLTFSCIAPQRGRHCGRCNKCAERKSAFAAARIPDTTRYDETAS